MQKIYILRENEEDGVLLDALLAQGSEPDEGELCNPSCPRCFSETLLAYTCGEDFEVITWSQVDEQDAEEADGWYMVCSNFECEWEEQVERVTDPMDATIFDLESASFCLDEEWGLCSRSPEEQKDLINYIKELQQFRKARKLQAFLEEAEWRYKDSLKRIQKWLDRVPPGRMIEIALGEKVVTGTMLAATDAGCMLMSAGGEVVSVGAEAIHRYWPRRFDRWGPNESEEPPSTRPRLSLGPDSYVINSDFCRVVVAGHELVLQHVDRLGQYHVSCRDPEAARSLGLEQKAEGYWSGRFRRSAIQMRYDVTRMARVKGYWFKIMGENQNSARTVISTEDEEAAVALGLRQCVPLIFEEEGEPSLAQRTPRWQGSVPHGDVDQYTEVKSYYWPLPEVHTGS